MAVWEVSDEQERQLGNVTDAVAQRSFNLLDDEHPLTVTVDRIGQRLAKVSDRPAVTYRFKVINDPKWVNALANPGGFIYVTSSLMRLVESEDELAAAIAHEIGHVVARHSIRELQRRQQLAFVLRLATDAAAATTAGVIAKSMPNNPAADLAARSGAAAAGTLTAQAGGLFATLLLRAHDRDEEREADALALRYLERAGYRVEAASALFCRFQALAAREGSGGGGLFSTHPAPAERCRTAPGRSR